MKKLILLTIVIFVLSLMLFPAIASAAPCEGAPWNNGVGQYEGAPWNNGVAQYEGAPWNNGIGQYEGAPWNNGVCP